MLAQILTAHGKGSFSRLRDYIGAEAKTDAVWTGNLRNDGTAGAEMAEVASQNPWCKRPVLHYMLAWVPGEKPSDVHVRKAVDGSLEALGLGDHQWMAARHFDAAASHVHVVVNRVDPQTFYASAPRRAPFQLQLFCRGFETEHRYNRHEGATRLDWSSGYPIFVGGDVSPIKGRARDGEVWSGQMSLVRWSQGAPLERLVGDLQDDPSWSTLHRSLADFGLRYEIAEHGTRRGGFLLDVTGEKTYRAAASDVHAGLGLNRIELQLGPYEPMEQNVPLPMRGYGRLRERSLVPMPELMHPNVYPLFLEHRRARAAWETGELHSEITAARSEMRASHAERRRLFEAAIKRERWAIEQTGDLAALAAHRTDVLDRRARERREKKEQRDAIRLMTPPVHFRTWLKQHAAAGNPKAGEALLCLREIHRGTTLTIASGERHFILDGRTMNDRPGSVSRITLEAMVHRLRAHAGELGVDLEAPVEIEDGRKLLRSRRIGWALLTLDDAERKTGEDGRPELTFDVLDNGTAESLLESVEERLGPCALSAPVREVLRIVAAEEKRFADIVEVAKDAQRAVGEQTPSHQLKFALRTLAGLQSARTNLEWLPDQSLEVRLPFAGHTSWVAVPELLKELHVLARARAEEIEAARATPTLEGSFQESTQPQAERAKIEIDLDALRKRAHETYREYLRTASAPQIWERFYARVDAQAKKLAKYEEQSKAALDAKDRSASAQQRRTIMQAERMRDEADIFESHLIEYGVIAQFTDAKSAPMSFREMIESRVAAGETEFKELLDGDDLSVSADDLPAYERRRWDQEREATIRDTLLNKRAPLFAKSLTWTEQDDVIYYTFGNAMQAAFSDDGKRIDIYKTGRDYEDRTIAIALRLAHSRYGQLELTGPVDFQRRALAVAVRYGMESFITNPELERDKERLVTSREASRAEERLVHVDPQWQERFAAANSDPNRVLAQVDVVADALRDQVAQYLDATRFRNDGRIMLRPQVLKNSVIDSIPLGPREINLGDLETTIHVNGPTSGKLITTLTAPSGVAYAVLLREPSIEKSERSVGQRVRDIGKSLLDEAPIDIAIVPIGAEQAESWLHESGNVVNAIPGRRDGIVPVFALEMREQERRVETRSLGYER